MKIYTSEEDYLETIYVLSKENNGYVRSIDVARHLGFSKPSVSIAVKNLKEAGYLLIGEKGNLILTDEGRQVAEKVNERHEVLMKMLTNLGVSPEVAKEDSCKLEHVISDETFERIKAHIENIH